MQARADAFPTPARGSIVVDLVGDLDDEMASLAAEALGSFTESEPYAVFISTKRLALATREGLARLGAAVDALRSSGRDVCIDAGNRKMRSTLADAGIVCDRNPRRPHGLRAVMIAHHALRAKAAPSLARTARRD